MTTTATRQAATLRASFSFYLPATNGPLIAGCADVADAVTIRGPDGPNVIGAMRRNGFDGTVLFDAARYERDAKPLDPSAWFDAQRDAGADRVLTPGRWVAWDKSGDALRDAIEVERAPAASSSDVTMLLAVDSRWITKGIYTTIAALKDVPEPTALVLAHRDDPLGSSDAVNNLLALTRGVSKLTLLRSDHGSVGAIAFGARHASVGLRPVYRHFVPPNVVAGAIPNDRTPRVFVWDLMDWFSASTIAGWGASRVRIACTHECCGGQSLDRFLDARLIDQADIHNRTVLAFLADQILDTPLEDRRRLFGRLCSDAVERYGPMGKLSMVTRPKRQLLQWAQFV